LRDEGVSLNNKEFPVCRGAWRRVGFYLALGLLVLLPARGATVPEDDFYANSLTSAKVLQQWYNERGLWDTTGWWNAANCLEAIESVIEVTNGEQYLEVIRTTFDRNQNGNFLNEFYDDEGWWAEAWIRAFDLTGEERYLAMAKTIFTDMVTGWGDHCGGGIWWKKDDRYKNAIANELFLLVAIRLHQRTPGDRGPGSYLDWAQREWAWFQQSGMINAQRLVNDGLTEQCENNRRTTWTYNQGVIIGGLVELYRATGDTNCLAQAIAIGDAAIATLVGDTGILQEPNERRGLRGADGPQFKGIFIRHLAELYDATGQSTYREFLVRNARSVWRNNRDDENRFGGRWAGPVDRVDAARHSSALRVITALAARPVSASGQLRRGGQIWAAASLQHEVGRRRGLNQWAAHPIENLASGYLVNGPGTKELVAGEYEVSFELSVDNFNRDQAPVAVISVVNLDTKQVEAERELRRSDFPNVLFQSFSLHFKARGGQRYDFRTFWHRTATAPQLTQLSVTLQPSSATR
jgi:predicted alpha-1,6-mannanase (GH76 family)